MACVCRGGMNISGECKGHRTTPAPFNIRDLVSPRPVSVSKYISPTGHLPAFGPGKATRDRSVPPPLLAPGFSVEKFNAITQHSAPPPRALSASPWGQRPHTGKYQYRAPVEASPGPAAYTVPRFPAGPASTAGDTETLHPLGTTKDQQGPTKRPPSCMYRGHYFGAPLSNEGIVRSSFGGAPRFPMRKKYTGPGPATYNANSGYRILGGAHLGGNSPRTVQRGVVDPKSDVFIPFSRREDMSNVGPASYDLGGPATLGNVKSHFFTHNIQLRRQAEARENR
jgi:hypothetical protein